ncbi:c-type cytochrome biogenesis protein CcmI [Ferribacterium limneticum]|uniref:c-type cytochrome biogenesis protein CcmI n=1 Tax=Ferribacterium limneticum TaxID=76259 RepID=UPI001CFBDC05|nr:c-type cytochrome biogenesis protein CcmI [Ferribacterium limneticum]UCV28321.1 c-type cytochrome biogenesis protein CcmI [Ferribacterium limneticum]UCV32238.1 c-type cytochrome biogenesis protein CcmI [Ferribacterium limneticum]
MTQFAIFATLLIVVVAAFILPPLWLGLRAPKPKTDRKEANLAIFRDQLAELEHESTEGSLAAADFEQAKRELQRRLLEEVEPSAADGVAATHGPSRKTAIAILLLLPILGLLGYGMLGNPKALDPTQTAAPQQMTPEKINEMVASLAAKMKANPDDMQGWLMLARSYKSLGRYDEAVEAFAKAEKAIDKDPDQLAAYAETVAMANGKGLKGKPAQLVEKALKVDPKHGHSLFLAGAAAMESGDNKKGIAYWEALLEQVEPGSEIDQMLRSGIEKMKAGK